MRRTPAARGVAALLVLLAATACRTVRAPGPEALRPVGAYAGELPDGRALELDLAWTPAGLLGAARVDAQPAAFVQRGGQRVAGEVLLSSGEVLPVFIDLAAGGLVSVTTQQGGVRLDRRARARDWSATGGLAGRYLATDSRTPLDRVTLFVDGKAAWGHASVLGRPALVAGWVQPDGSLRGELVFEDSSALEFEARGAGADSLEVRTGGAPATLRRHEP